MHSWYINVLNGTTTTTFDVAAAFNTGTGLKLFTPENGENKNLLCMNIEAAIIGKCRRRQQLTTALNYPP